MSENNPLAMLGAGMMAGMRGISHVVRWLTVAIAFLAATAVPALASSSCAAVNAGAFNLNATLSASSSTILTAWNVGDRITLTLGSSLFGSVDGFYHGPTFASGTFGSLSTIGVPSTGSVNLSHTVTSTDLTNGIAVDPENNDLVTATCAPVAPTVNAVSPSSGPLAGGTQVTITGTSFLGVTAVTFGATAATSFTANSDTSITATSPAGTGTVNITVTNSGGTSATGAADQFSYLPPPSVTGISPNRGSTAGGTVVSITGQNFTGATAVNFGAGTATTVTVNSATSITATSPPGSSGTVDVTVTTPSGTSATSSADHFTYVILPTVTSISPTNGPKSGGTIVTITGTNFTGASAVKFGSATAASFTLNSATQITATSPAASVSTVDVTVTTPSGTSTISAADQFTYGSFRTWVSATSGSDINPCTTALPCLTFAGALANTAPSGEIDVLTPGDYGPVTVTTALSIYNDGVGTAGALTTSGTSGIVINAGPNDAVNLRGLVFDGFSASGASGVVFNSGAQLHIANCVFQGFATSGITFAPGSGSAATAEMVVQDLAILANGAGLSIKPIDGIAAHVTLNKIHIDSNTGGGLRADGTGGSGAVKIAVKDSSVSLNASNGINAVSGPGNVGVNIMRSVIASNGLAGIQSNQTKGGTAGVNVGYSEIYGNATGVASVGGGALLSYPNNQVSGNTANGSFTGTATLQ